MRIMLDINVLISLFVFPSDKFERLKRSIAKQQIVLCQYVIEETKDVVERKFPNKVKDLDEFFQSLPYIMSYTPEHIDKTAYPAIRDEADLPILVSAILEDVDILITRDKDFLDMEIEKPEMLDISDYLEQYS